jgi:PAS domain S-box-containing protein
MGYFDWNLVTNEIQWSPETFRLFGRAPGGVFSPTIEATVGMVPDEHRAFVQARLDAVIRGDANYDIIHPVVRPDGQIIHVHAKGEVMRDEQGKAVRMLGTVVDVTERMAAEEALRTSKERLKQALGAASAGMWEWDIRTGRVICSKEHFDLQGLHLDGRNPTLAEWQTCLHPDDVAPVTAALQAAVDGFAPEYRAEFRVHHAPAGERWLLAVGQVKRSFDGAPVRVTGISIDITGRKRAEENLREVDRRRSDFLGVLSHELRNPLAPIRNSLYLLQNLPPGIEQLAAINIIDRQVTHLSRLVEDLLDVTRISSGKIRLQSAHLDIVALVRRTLEDHRTLLGEREVKVDLPEETLWCTGDATRLAQVLGNLLTNAAKFTPESGRVSVSLRRDQGRAALEVADTGLGIDPETLTRLFVPFSQADRSLDRNRGGLGLGLALVKALVEMHGGEVRARSEGPACGASFTVWLPLVGPAPATAGPPPQHEQTVRRRKVLVIEDNRDAAQSLAAALAHWGHEVSVAFDGMAGLAEARRFKPDVVLCDIGLPGDVDGYAVARALREDATQASIYRVALTGYARPEDQMKAREAGFHAHFAKPGDLVTLAQLLAQAPSPWPVAAARGLSPAGDEAECGSPSG